MRISARNALKGIVKKVTEGAVNSEVLIELPGGQEVVSIVTKNSVESLGIAVGKEAYAIVKGIERHACRRLNLPDGRMPV